MMTQILRVLLGLAAAWCVLSAVAFLYAERILFQPPPPSYTRNQLDYTEVPVGEGEFVVVQHVANPGARHTVLFSHGNAEDLGHLQEVIARIHGAGLGVLAYDYRGYGRSSASMPTEKGAIEDADAVYRHATETLGIPANRLIVHGRSLGGGPALEVAARHPVAGVILESTFVSTNRVLTRVRLLPFDRFPNLARVRRLNVPVLVIHGERDRVISPSHGRALYRAVPEPKRALWVDGAGHNDLTAVAGDRYQDALRRFAEELP